MLLTNSTLNCPTSMSKIVVVSDRVNSISVTLRIQEGKGEDMNFMFEWQEQEGHKTIANAKHVIFLLLCGLYRDGTRIFQSGSWDAHVRPNWGPKHFLGVPKSW